MDALVRICEDELIAIKSVTAMPEPDAFDLSCPNQLAANQNTHACYLNCSNRLVSANQNAHAFGLSSSLARQKMRMRMRYSRSQNVSIFILYFKLVCFLASSVLSLAFNFSADLPR